MNEDLRHLIHSPLMRNAILAAAIDALDDAPQFEQHMPKNVMTSSEIIQAIESEAIRQLGPWPCSLDIFIYRLDDGWECLITHTNDPITSQYRTAALRIGKAQESFIALKE